MAASGKLKGFAGPDAPAPEKIGSCVHCGVCLPVCPTYRESRNEASSPRGRIYLMRAISEGRLSISGGFAGEVYSCLACRACETACPAGVRYGDLVERSRAQVEETLPRSIPARLLRWLLLQGLVPHRRRLSWVVRGLRVYQKTGIGEWLGDAGLLDGFLRLKAAESLAPLLDDDAVQGVSEGTHPARGSAERRVAFFRGCIQDAVFGGTNRRTVDLLQENRADVAVPGGQTCCGALHLHQGMREEAKGLARRNLEAFAGVKAEAIIVNAAGCGAALKEYGDLLGSDGEVAEEARKFAGKVRDVSEYLASLPTRRPFRPLPATAVYQDACHLAHAQGIRSAPRVLLGDVPDLHLKPLSDPDSCCGSAGVYNLTHPEAARAVLGAKMDSIAAADPDLIITGNPGCLLQLRLGVRERGLRARVIHTVDALSGRRGEAP